MIYFLEDDPSIRKLVIYTLNSQGMEAEGFELPSQFWAAMERQLPSLVLLDLMLPEEDGLHILKRIRAGASTARLPVILITAKGTEYDKVVGLDGGADDYIAKPFRARELLSRIRAALRRTSGASPVLALGDVEIDAAAAVVRKGGVEVALSALEYRLLLLFAQNPDKLVTREAVRNAIWDSAGEYVSDNTLNVYIKRLRDKVESDPSHPQLIQTVRGMGYKAGS